MMFGCTFGGGGLPKDSGNVDILVGQSSSPVSGFNFDYLFKEEPDNFVDYLIPQAGIPMFKSQDSLVRAVCWSGSTNRYRALYSTVIFGAFRDSPSSKNELMLTYLNYLFGL